MCFWGSVNVKGLVQTNRKWVSKIVPGLYSGYTARELNRWEHHCMYKASVTTFTLPRHLVFHGHGFFFSLHDDMTITFLPPSAVWIGTAQEPFCNFIGYMFNIINIKVIFCGMNRMAALNYMKVLFWECWEQFCLCIIAHTFQCEPFVICGPEFELEGAYSLCPDWDITKSTTFSGR